MACHWMQDKLCDSPDRTPRTTRRRLAAAHAAPRLSTMQTIAQLSATKGRRRPPPRSRVDVTTKSKRARHNVPGHAERCQYYRDTSEVRRSVERARRSSLAERATDPSAELGERYRPWCRRTED